jgi:hypothetical protein
LIITSTLLQRHIFRTNVFIIVRGHVKSIVSKPTPVKHPFENLFMSKVMWQPVKTKGSFPDCF